MKLNYGMLYAFNLFFILLTVSKLYFQLTSNHFQPTATNSTQRYPSSPTTTKVTQNNTVGEQMIFPLVCVCVCVCVS